MTVGAFPLQGKIVVVTGGGSGISLAFAQLAASQDAKVIIADLRLTSEAEDWRKQSKNVLFTRCDVTVWTDLENLIHLSEKEFGDVPDIYIAGAGVFDPPWSNFWSDTETSHYASIDINVSHPIKLTRIAIRALLSKNKPGVVLLISSAAGLIGSYPTALYCATKHALVGFTMSLGPADKEENVKVVCICPGIVATPLWQSSPAQMAQYSYSPAIAVEPSVVATAMAELISEDQYPGGTVMRIGITGKEVVEYEREEGTKESQATKWSNEEMKARRWAPVREIMKGERKG